MRKAILVSIFLAGLALALYVRAVRTSDAPAIETNLAEIARARQAEMGAAVFFGRISLEEREPVKACRVEPESCQRFVDLYHTWRRAILIETAIMLQPQPVLPATSEELTHEGIIKTDVWDRPFCLFRMGGALAVVSRGPNGERTCTEIEVILPELFRSQHLILQLPRTGEVVVIGG